MKLFKAALIIWVIMVGVILNPLAPNANAGFIMELKPLAFLFSSDISDFKATRSTFGSSYEEVSIGGSASIIPQLKIGGGVDLHVMYLDFTTGIGFLFNNAFYASILTMDTALRLKVGRNVTIGPQFGIMRFNPTWDDSSDINLKNDLGWIIGTGITIGARAASFSLSFDYISASFDVTTGSGWRANESSLDISGFAIQCGVLFRF